MFDNSEECIATMLPASDDGEDRQGHPSGAHQASLLAQKGVAPSHQDGLRASAARYDDAGTPFSFIVQGVTIYVNEALFLRYSGFVSTCFIL
jgi:hypothetical protein